MSACAERLFCGHQRKQRLPQLFNIKASVQNRHIM